VSALEITRRLLTFRMTSSVEKLDEGPDSSMSVDPEAAGDGVVDASQLSSESSDNLLAKENRVTKKAHRTSKNGGTTEAVEANGVQSGSSHDGASKHGVNAVHKSHRRRRHARGRVQLKKGTTLH